MDTNRIVKDCFLLSLGKIFLRMISLKRTRKNPTAMPASPAICPHWVIKSIIITVDGLFLIFSEKPYKIAGWRL